MEKIIFFSLVIPILGFVLYLGATAIMKGFSAKEANRNEKEKLETDVENNESNLKSFSNKEHLSEELNNLNETPQHRHFTPDDPRFADLNEGAADEIAGRALASYSELCADRTDDIRRGFMISSEAIVRMQSAAYDVDPDEEFGDKMCDGTHMACP